MMLLKRSLIIPAVVLLTIPAWADPDVTSEPIANENPNPVFAESADTGTTGDTSRGGGGDSVQAV